MKEFFKDTLSLINENKNELIRNLLEKLHHSTLMLNNIFHKSLSIPIFPYISGYAVIKFINNNTLKYKMYIELITYSINISNEHKKFLDYNISYLSNRDNIGLT